MDTDSQTSKLHEETSHSTGLDSDLSGLSNNLDQQKTTKKGKWTAEEDELLKKAVEYYGEKRWKDISSRVPGRNAVQCLHRWNKTLRPGIVKGPWTAEEKATLQAWVEKNGPCSWAKCAQLIPGRNGKQCREHWLNQMKGNIKKGDWTVEEDEKIYRLFQVYGTKWTQMQKYLPGRTENSIKNRFYAAFRRLLAVEDIDSETPVLKAGLQNKSASGGDDDLSSGNEEVVSKKSSPKKKSYSNVQSPAKVANSNKLGRNSEPMPSKRISRINIEEQEIALSDSYEAQEPYMEGIHYSKRNLDPEIDIQFIGNYQEGIASADFEAFETPGFGDFQNRKRVFHGPQNVSNSVYFEKNSTIPSLHSFNRLSLEDSHHSEDFGYGQSNPSYNYFCVDPQTIKEVYLPGNPFTPFYGSNIHQNQDDSQEHGQE